jgi:hypothetical protein
MSIADSMTYENCVAMPKRGTATRCSCIFIGRACPNWSKRGSTTSRSESADGGAAPQSSRRDATRYRHGLTAGVPARSKAALIGSCRRASNDAQSGALRYPSSRNHRRAYRKTNRVAMVRHPALSIVVEAIHGQKYHSRSCRRPPAAGRRTPSPRKSSSDRP